jgi:hypothetical protein
VRGERGARTRRKDEAEEGGEREREKKRRREVQRQTSGQNRHYENGINFLSPGHWHGEIKTSLLPWIEAKEGPQPSAWSACEAFEARVGCLLQRQIFSIGCEEKPTVRPQMCRTMVVLGIGAPGR